MQQLKKKGGEVALLKYPSPRHHNSRPGLRGRAGRPSPAFGSVSTKKKRANERKKERPFAFFVSFLSKEKSARETEESALEERKKSEKRERGEKERRRGSYFGVGEAGERDEEGKDKAREGFHFEGKKKKPDLVLFSFLPSLHLSTHPPSSITAPAPRCGARSPAPSPAAQTPRRAAPSPGRPRRS